MTIQELYNKITNGELSNKELYRDLNRLYRVANLRGYEKGRDDACNQLSSIGCKLPSGQQGG